MKRLAALLLALGCATAAPPPPPIPDEPPPVPVATRAPAPAPPSCTAFVRPGVLRRSALQRTSRGTLGAWLHDGPVLVDPLMEKKRFRGWIIRTLYPNDPCYQLVDLRPGDVVLKVNGKSIERPEAADEVFRSVGSSPALEVDFLREGAPMKLTFQIAEE